MTERWWAWLIWWLGLLTLVLLAIPSLGFTVPFIIAWWVGGPFYVSEDGDVAPFWKPMGPGRLWWREIPDERRLHRSQGIEQTQEHHGEGRVDAQR